MAKQTITVVDRIDDFHASIPSGYWDKGRTPAEAIGNLLLSHPERFAVKIEVEAPDNRGPTTVV